MEHNTAQYWIERTQDHFVSTFTFDLGRYLVAAGALTLILWLAKSWADARRIQRRRPTRRDYIREISSSFRTVFFFALTGMATVLMIETGVIDVREEPVGMAIFTLQIAAIALAHDAYFYWMHRALHTKRLFRATHLHHHKSRTPTSWAAYSFSAWEGIAESAFMPLYLLIAAFFGIAYSDFAIFFFLGWMILRNVIGHAGVEVHPAGWVDSKWLDWLTTTTHHDLHHSEGNHNFGLYFTWWDRWMGTEHPQYKERFRNVAKSIIITKRFAETTSVTLVAMLASLASLATLGSAVGALPL